MKTPDYSSHIRPNPIGKYINVMTILVSEKDCILQGLSLSSLWTWRLYHTEGLQVTRESYHRCCDQESDKSNRLY